MSIDPSTLDALRVVRSRPAFETRNQDIPAAEVRDQVGQYVGAARYLADEVERLHAVMPTGSLPVVTLDEAARLLQQLITSTCPATGNRMPDWPNAPKVETADLVTMTLVLRVLPVIAAHADQLTKTLHSGGNTIHDIAHLVAELYRRVLDRPLFNQGPAELSAWAHLVRVPMQELAGLAGIARDRLHHRADNEITAAEFCAEVREMFKATGFLSIRQAISVLHTLASKGLPDGRTISWWPLHVPQDQIVNVGQVLDRALLTITNHADVLGEHAPWPQPNVSLAEFMPQMHGRVAQMQVTATSANWAAFTDLVQSGIHLLTGYLPRTDNPVVAELDAAQTPPQFANLDEARTAWTSR